MPQARTTISFEDSVLSSATEFCKRRNMKVSPWLESLAIRELKQQGQLNDDLREELISSLPEPTPENEAHLRKLIECNAALIREETLAANEPATA